jgi:TatD DNase family protein
MPEYIDIHCHLDDAQYESDRLEVLSRLTEQNIWAITIGTDIQSSAEAIKIANGNDSIFAIVGMHPRHEEKFDEKAFSQFSLEKKVVGIGECGLDYFKLDESRVDIEKKRQLELFEFQIELAVKNNLPLMLHCRDAYSDVVEILESKNKEYGEGLWGNAHFFAGNVEIARRLWNIGFSTSFTGVITFARNYDEIIKIAPLELIMSETDAPYVAPVPMRGKRNEPSNVKEVVKVIAEIRSESDEVVKMAMVRNALRIFPKMNYL